MKRRIYLLMSKVLLTALLATTALFGQYKLESTGAPPDELAPAVKEALQASGAKIVGADGSALCEIWFRKSLPSGPASTEQGVSLTTVPHGAMLGVIRFPKRGQDRRGLTIPEGVYTLRYSLFPPDGNHQGVAAQRDFLLLVPAAGDTDVNSTPSFKEVVAMSAKTTGGSHPASLSLWKDEAGHEPGLVQEGESDWVLHAKIGDTAIGLIVVGVFQG
jgi:hypothetical protein